MSKTTSRWRLEARRRIADIVGQMRPDATANEIALALRGKCPWGKVNHPYQCWLLEAREAVQRAEQDASRKARPTVLIVCSGYLKSKLWLHVECGWCELKPRVRQGGVVASGCLMCGRHQSAVDAIAHDREFQALRQDAVRDSRLESVLGDWLEDRIGTRAGL